MDYDVLSTMIPRFAAAAGVFMLAGVLPVFASFILDGTVRVIARKGAKQLIFATLMTLAIAILGLLGIGWGSEHDSAVLDTTASDISLARFFLVFSVPISLGACVVRLVRSANQDARPDKTRADSAHQY